MSCDRGLAVWLSVRLIFAPRICAVERESGRRCVTRAQIPRFGFCSLHVEVVLEYVRYKAVRQGEEQVVPRDRLLIQFIHFNHSTAGELQHIWLDQSFLHRTTTLV
jgi:hypothetical protein